MWILFDVTMIAKAIIITQNGSHKNDFFFLFFVCDMHDDDALAMLWAEHKMLRQ